MKRKYSLLFSALLIGALAVACGGGGTSSGGESSPDATSGDAGGGGGGMVDTGEFGSPEIAALLPTSVDGVNFTISTFDYSKIPLAQAAASFGDATLEGWLGKSGKTWADVRWGNAASDLGGDKSATVTVFRVLGADQASLLDWWGGSSLNTGGDGETTVTLGGNTVNKLAYPGLSMVFYQWVKGDTLYWVTADPESFGDAVVTATK